MFYVLLCCCKSVGLKCIDVVVSRLVVVMVGVLCGRLRNVSVWCSVGSGLFGVIVVVWLDLDSLWFLLLSVSGRCR